MVIPSSLPTLPMPPLNGLADKLGPSPTMSAAAALCTHPDPIDLTVGEPDALPPDPVREAAARAARDGRTKYGPAAGLPELREGIARDLEARDGVARSLEEVLVTSGGKAALHDALRCILAPGDEVVIFAPHWPTFRDQVLLNGGVPVTLPPGPDLLPSMDTLEASLGPRTRAMILNVPCNPTGRIWDGERIRRIADLALRHGLWLIVDQVYGTLGYEGPEVPFLRQVPELASQCVLIESFSKRFAMTGYRVGAASGPVPLIRAMASLASSTVSHPCTLSQHAALAALDMDGRWEEAMRDSLRRRRDLAVARLQGIEGIEAPSPQGAIYLFPKVEAWLQARGLPNDSALTARLRDKAGVKVLPGSVFGGPGHLRISFAAPQAVLERGLERLAAYLRQGA